MASIRQPSFASGELAPPLWGRTDLPRYAAGLRRLFNFFVSKQGNAVSRPGAQYLGTASLNTVNLNANSPPGLHLPTVLVTQGAAVRLIPFYYSDDETTQNYVLVFGEQYLGIRKNGSGLTFTLTGSIPYHAADLQKLKFAQSGDVITLACPGYPPATLTRGLSGTTVTGSESDWTYAVLSFDRPTPPSLVAGQPSGARIMEAYFGTVDAQHPAKAWAWLVTEIRKDAYGNVYETAPLRANGFVWNGSPWNPLITYKNRTVVYMGNVPGRSNTFDYWFALHDGVTSQPPLTNGNPTSDWYPVRSYDGSHTYGLGDVILDSGPVFRTSLQAGNQGNAETNTSFWSAQFSGFTSFQTDDYSQLDVQVPVYPDMPVQLWLTASSNPLTDPNFVAFRVYRGRANLFGWVGDSAGGSVSTNFFIDDVENPDYTLPPPQGLNPFQTGEYPNSVTYFADRRAFGGTSGNASTVRPWFFFLSAASDYSNFDQHYIPQPADALVEALTARKKEVIRSVVGVKSKLFVFSNSAVWGVGGTNESPIAPDNVDAGVEVDIGADWNQPLVVGGHILYVRDKGTGVRAIQFDWQRGGFASSDLSICAEHLVLGHAVADWCVVEDPWNLVWIVRDDGLLLSLTYAPDDQLWAWGQHQLVVANQPSTGYGVPSGIVQSVCSIPEGDEDVLYLAVQGCAAVPFNGATTYRVGDLVVSGGHFFLSKTAGNVGNTPPSDGSSDTHWSGTTTPVGPAWICRLSTRLITTLKRPACVDAYVEFDGSYAPTDQVGGSPGENLAGLAHLEGQQVMVQYDNATDTAAADTFGPYLVTGGFIVAAPPTRACSRVFVGLGYNCELELLDLPDGRTKRKVVTEVGLEVIGGGVLQAGQSLADTLKPSKVMKPGADLLRVTVAGSWNTGGRAALRQTNPLPVTVVGVTREVDAGDL